MQDTVAPVLTEWESFYVIIGSSAAALTGLMFVVITLVNDSRRRRSEQAVSAYSTPTIVHFGAALLISAIASAPWHGLGAAGLTMGVVGAAGIVYIALVLKMMSNVPDTSYSAVLEDWLFHVILPLIVYLAFLVMAFLLPRHPEPALFGIGGATLLLLFIGIHNAWDIVTFLVLGPDQPGADKPTPGA
ncbi:MAG TPA: hypothetical protein VGH98_03310 [Gemmatimonadaceae bacterium]